MPEEDTRYRYLYPWPEDMPPIHDWPWFRKAWDRVLEIDPTAKWQWAGMEKGGLAFDSRLPPEHFPFCEERYP